MKNYIFYYYMIEKPELIRRTAPYHTGYWNNLKTQGGPFADYSGGFVCFPAENYDNAMSIINKDPFIEKKVLKQFWLKEWIAS